MTATPCFGPDDLDRVNSLSASHELQVHARECPRCGALLASFRMFQDPSAGPSASQIEEAEARLSGAIARELGVPLPAPLGPASHAATPARTPDRDRTPGASWIQRLLHPSMRPALAVAALVIVAGAVTLMPRRAGNPPTDPLRGSSESQSLHIEEAALTDHGASFRWSPVPDAERYEVRLYSSNLQELGRYPAGANAFLTLSPDGLPATGSDGRMLYRVYALRGGHVVAFSTAAPLE